MTGAEQARDPFRTTKHIVDNCECPASTWRESRDELSAAEAAHLAACEHIEADAKYIVGLEAALREAREALAKIAALPCTLDMGITDSRLYVDGENCPSCFASLHSAVLARAGDVAGTTAPREHDEDACPYCRAWPGAADGHADNTKGTA